MFIERRRVQCCFLLQAKLQCDADTKKCVCAGGTKLTNDGSECVEAEAYDGDICPPVTKKCLGVTQCEVH